MARSGSCSLILKPGVRVAIVLKPPRISLGASGLGSQVSMWLGPPHWKIRMQDFARPNPEPEAESSAIARPRSNAGNPRPSDPSTPARSASRREGWRNSRHAPFARCSPG